MKNKLTLLRLEKQERKMEQDPVPNVMIARKDVLNFHFCIYGLDGVYQKGYYHGVLQLHQQYPFSPPKLLFYTPNGRFQTNKSICTTFTNFHKQTWTSAWNVRTMLMATVSFMTSDEGGYGSINDGSAIRRKYAIQSLSFNIKNPIFRSLFKQKLKKIDSQANKILIEQEQQNLRQPINNQSPQQRRVQSSNRVYFLYIALFVVLFFWAILKSS